MVIDTSALIAILFNEADAEQVEAKLVDAATRAISAVTLLESAIVAETRLGEDGGRELELLVYKSAVEVIPFDTTQLALARLAFRRYGKGHHRAALNFGDCIAYALARARSEPLLCKGVSFSATDIAIA
jgi:ribonuclease VapC